MSVRHDDRNEFWLNPAVHKYDEDVIHLKPTKFETIHVFTERYCKELFDKIKHGDQEHQDWLKNAIEDYFKNTEVAGG